MVTGSEIDDIFSSKGYANFPDKSTNTSVESDQKSKKRKKSKTQKHRDRPSPAIQENVEAIAPVKPSSEKAKDSPLGSLKRSAPETIVDPSLQLNAGPATKRQKKSSKGQEEQRAKETKNKDEEDIDRFKDSRGTGPRRRTEEGYLIYKEDELGIDPEKGGGKPLKLA
ncbi:hypothetical protein FRC02_005750 [Tulasnella sp. 418]|nr:hypothetical protein FRC02_005750 [Tulasnella sp. 418]